jgi:D-tagatose-1,6-bisphosphate aldolase subunit GatZ/KbaZ
VIGTEVPVPGGAHETLGELQATSPEAARATIEAHRVAFADAGVSHIWDRVVALVVQPAVEFDHLQVIHYDRNKTTDLRHILDDVATMGFEAHSTDYQTPKNLRDLVEDHWYIPKVGPGLTFALREGLFALAHIEDELIPAEKRSRLRDVVDEVMVAEPSRWDSYYEGTEDERRIARRYSFSDRLRYYWPEPAIHAAENLLLENLSGEPIPLPLLSQYLPRQYSRIVEGTLANDPREIAMDKVRDALDPYSYACIPGSEMRP